MRRRAIIACAYRSSPVRHRAGRRHPSRLLSYHQQYSVRPDANVATQKKYYEAENLKIDSIVAGAAVEVVQQLAAGSRPMNALSNTVRHGSRLSLWKTKPRSPSSLSGLIQALPGHQINTNPGNRIASQAGTDMLGSA
jgi:hypothetical protein